jgi:c-di-GMP-binding flagellar brake protein YcgR
MNIERIERRENKRVFFAVEENVGVILKPSRKLAKSFPGNLLTLSTGGFSIAIPKNRKKSVREGEIVMMAKLRLPGSNAVISGVEAEVKHILFFEKMDRITIGCELKNLPAFIKQQIEAFIDKRIAMESEKRVDKERSEREFTVP